MKHRRIGWKKVLAAAIVCLFAVPLGIILVLRSPGFRGWALREIIQTAEERTGTRITIQALDLSLYPFVVNLRGVTVRGTELANEKPLFRAEQVRIHLAITPLLRKQVRLERLILVKPEIAIRVNPQGQSNLPPSRHPQPASGASGLSIPYAAVHDGLISYNDKTVPLAAEVYGLEADLRATPGTNRYRGRLRYDSGRVRVKGFQPIEHSLSAAFNVDESRCVIDPWQVKTRNSSIHGLAQIANYQNPLITAQYDATVEGQDLALVLKSRSVPNGAVQLEGNVRYTSAPTSSVFLDLLDVDGAFQSKSLRLAEAQSGIRFEKIRGQFTLKKGLLRITNIDGQTLGGVLRSENDVIDLVKDSGALHVYLRGAQLREFGNPLQQGPERVRLASIGTVDAAARWENGFAGAEYHVKAVLQGSPGPSLRPQDIPADGTVEFTYEPARSRLVFRDSSLHAGQTHLRLAGEMSKRSALSVDLQTEDLHSLVAMVASIQPSPVLDKAMVRNLRGRSEFNGRVTGAPGDPQIVGRLTGRELLLDDTQWSSLETNLGLNSRSLKLENLVASSTAGQIRASVELPLSHWTLERAEALSVQAKMQTIPVATMQKAAGTAYPVEGLLSGEVRITGSVDQPAANGHLDLTAAVVYNEPLTEVHADFSAKGKSMALSGNARGPAGALTARLSYDLLSQVYDLEGQTDHVDLAQIHTLHAKTQDLQGQVSATISGKGTLDDPRFDAQIESANLNIRGEDFKQFSLRLNGASHRADLHLRSRVEGAEVNAKGSVELTGNYASDVTIDTGIVSIAPILQKYLPSKASAASGQLEIHAHVSGPLKQLEQIQGQADVTNLRLAARKNVEFSNPRPIRLEYRSGVLEVKDAALKGNGTDLSVSGSIPLGGGKVYAKAQGSLDLKSLESFDEGGTAAGRLKLELAVSGTWQAPQMSGTLELQNAAYISDSLPVGIESVNGTISIHDRHIQVEHLAGLAGGGKLSIGGGGDIGAAPAYAFTLSAQSMRVRQNGARAVVDANLALNGGKDKSTLTGQVLVHKLAFSQSSDLAEIAAAFSSDDTVEEPSAFLEKIKLNVSVASDDQLALASNQLSIAGAANLNVTGNLARPVLLGRISLTSGEVFFLGKRFEIQNGTILFRNAVRTNPVANLALTTTVEQYHITINLTGTLDKLRTTYTSDPTLPSADIIHLLAFGQTTTEGASNASVPATLSAESAVANAVGSQVAGQLQKVTGISQLSIDPMAGNNQNPGAQVAVQQRVAGNLLVTFSTDITNAQSQAVQLKYQWKPNITVSILRDENGGYGLDVRYHKAF